MADDNGTVLACVHTMESVDVLCILWSILKCMFVSLQWPPSQVEAQWIVGPFQMIIMH